MNLKMYFKLLSATLLIISPMFSNAQDAFITRSFFDQGDYTLHLPSIKLGNNTYGNARIQIQGDKAEQFRMISELSKEEKYVHEFILNHACSSSGNLEKIAAFRAYLTKESSYCLKLSRSSTVEGGSVVSYLIIENQGVKYIGDVRGDGYAKCCYQVQNDFRSLKLGIMENGEFVEIILPDTVALDQEFILHLEDPDGYIYEI